MTVRESFCSPARRVGLLFRLHAGPVEVAKSGLDGEVLKGKLIHRSADACSDGRFQRPESAKAEGLVSVLSAPLMVNGKAIGILRVYSSEERDFTRTNAISCSA